MPLIALLNDEYKEALTLTERDRKKDFRCPACQDKLTLVLPKKEIVKHFRHKSGREHWEPETLEHLIAKKTVYDEALKLGWSATLEKQIENTVVADVLLKEDELKIAVECQCTPLSLERFRGKNQFYSQQGIISLWIFGRKFYVKTQEKIPWKKIDHGKIGPRVSNHGLSRFFRKKVYKKYDIQRIGRVERDIINNGLYYLVDSEFFQASFQKRWYSKVLGWYRLQKTSLLQILLEALSNVS